MTDDEQAAAVVLFLGRDVEAEHAEAASNAKLCKAMGEWFREFGPAVLRALEWPKA